MREHTARESLLEGYEALRNRDFATAALAFGRGASLEPDNSALLHGAAVAARRMGDFRLAESHYRAAMAAVRRPDGGTANRLAIATRLVELYRRHGRDAEAEALCLSILRDRPAGHSAIARSRLYVCLANIYQQKGQLAAAEQAYRAAVRLRRRVFGDRHPKTVQILSPLANVCRHLGRHAEADELTRRSTAAFETVVFTTTAGHA